MKQGNSIFHHADSKELRTLVENKTSFNTDFAQFSFFETFVPSYDFNLEFDAVSFIHMLEGKKIMHIGEETFDYLPNESILLKPNEKMLIDFPLASKKKPTRCIALTIDDSFIKKNINRHNEFYKKITLGEHWHFDIKKDFNRMRDDILNVAIKRFLYIFTMPLPQKEFFFKNAIKELLIILMQNHNRDLIVTHSSENKNAHALAHVVDYIKSNIAQNIDLEVLYKKALLSKAHFFKAFKVELGMTPMEFIMNEKLHYSQSLLKTTKLPIYDVAMQCGFENTSHFSQRFKKKFGCTPSELRAQIHH